MKKASTRRRLAAILACALAAAIVVSGAYAVVLLNQFDTNEFGGKGLRYDATLNEEFLEEENWKKGQTVDKLISVTNTGMNDGNFGEVYVRLQLKEFMETFQLEYLYWNVDGEKVSAPGGSKPGNPGLFMTYTTGNGVSGQAGIEIEDHQAHVIVTGLPSMTQDAVAAEAARQYPNLVKLDPDIFKNNRKFVYLTDAVSEKSGWFVQTREGDINGQYGKWVVAEFARDGSTSRPIDSLTQRADNHDHGNHDQSGAAPSECKYTPYIYEAGMRGYDRTAKYREWVQWNFGSTVMPLSQWAGEQCWLYDDIADNGEGWFYWSHPLTPDANHATLKKTTEILLQSIELKEQPEGDFYYAIHVDMEAESDPWITPYEPTVFRVSPNNDGANVITVAPGGSVGFTSSYGSDNVTAGTTWGVDNVVRAGSFDGTFAYEPAQGKAMLRVSASETGTFNIVIIATYADQPPVKVMVQVKSASNDLDVEEPDDPLKGFPSFVDPTDADKSHTTQVGVEDGEIFSPVRRYATIALDTILKIASEAAGTNATAVDPALEDYIKTYDNTFIDSTVTPAKTLGDEKRSIVCEWIPLTQADLAELDDEFSSISYDADGAIVLTTKVLLTNGTKEATVTVTFYFTHSYTEINV